MLCYVFVVSSFVAHMPTYSQGVLMFHIRISIIDNTDEVLKEDGYQEQANKLSTNKEILIEQLAELKEIAKLILSVIDESKLDDEIFESKDYAASIRFCITKIESRMNQLVQNSGVVKANEKEATR